MSLKGKTLTYGTSRTSSTHHAQVNVTKIPLDAKEPAFLRRMRDQTAGLDPDRHERAIARPRRVNAKVDDDEPTYVDSETSNIVSKHDFDALVAENEESQTASAAVEEQSRAVAADEPALPDGDSRKKQEVTQAGRLQKKRKSVKVVGVQDDDDDSEQVGVASTQPKKTSVKRTKNDKGVKLSFVAGENEEGG